MSTSNDAAPAAAAAAAAAAAEPAPSATYNASCHCGAVAYRVTVSPPLDHPTSSVSSCNCSICVRNGYLLIYVPSKDVEFEKGEGAMTVGLGFPFFFMLSPFLLLRLLSPPSFPVSFSPFPLSLSMVLDAWLGDGGEEIGGISAGRAGRARDSDEVGDGHVERSGEANCRVCLFC